MCRGPCAVAVPTAMCGVAPWVPPSYPRPGGPGLYMCTVSSLRAASRLLVVCVVPYPWDFYFQRFHWTLRHCAPAAELHVSGASCAPPGRGGHRQTPHTTNSTRRRDESRQSSPPHTNHHVDVTVDTPWRRPRRADATRRNIKLRTQTRLDTDLSPHLTSQPQACPVPAPERAKNLVRL